MRDGVQVDGQQGKGKLNSFLPAAGTFGFSLGWASTALDV